MKVLHDWDNIDPDNVGERRAYLETLIQLDLLANVTPVLGIRDVIFETYPHLIQELEERYGDAIDCRVHIHIGDDYTDEARTRHWVPELNQPKHTWHYDSKLFNDNELTMLKNGELPIIHVDRPKNLSKYIEYLYGVKREEVKIYE